MNTNTLWNGAAPLDHLGLIRVRGADAAKFLHSQLTSDFSLLGLSHVRLAGYCSAKGRLQASFIAWKSAHDEVLLACSASVLPATLKRLSMFVLRAQCRLSDASAELRLTGLVGTTAQELLGDTPVWQKREVQRAGDGCTVLRLPDAVGMVRAVRVDAAGAVLPPMPSLSVDQWRWLEVRSGVPMIEAATVEQFVPQMLNLELLGGVDFQKGCYPGQEVVARSQYRGTVKRRMFLFESGAATQAGAEVYTESDPGQPAGMVVNAAPQPDGVGSVALVELKLAALDAGALHLQAADGPLLRRIELPYHVPTDAAQTA
jgi:hypothetical protein